MVEFYKNRGRDERSSAQEGRKASVKEALTEDKKEADWANGAKTRAAKKQNKEPER